MENTTAQAPAQSAVILTHPRFDRPKVVQPKRTGRYPRGVTRLLTDPLQRYAAQLKAKGDDTREPDPINRLEERIVVLFGVSDEVAACAARAATTALKGFSAAR